MQWRGSGFVVLGWWYVVAVVGAVGTLMMAFGDVRWGGRILSSAFLFGAVASAAMFPAVIRRLPESLDFLLARRPPDALPRLNHLLRRMGKQELAELPPPRADENAHRNPVSRLFAARL